MACKSLDLGLILIQCDFILTNYMLQRPYFISSKFTWNIEWTWMGGRPFFLVHMVLPFEEKYSDNYAIYNNDFYFFPPKILMTINDKESLIYQRETSN